MSLSKTCTKCGLDAPLSDFNKDKNTKDGRVSACKQCIKYSKSRYHSQNREKVQEKNALYYAANRAEISRKSSAYYADNREHVRERGAQYYAENRDLINETDRKRKSESQNLTKALASIPPHTRWIPGEDALLLSDNGMTIYQKAVELGRTYISCSRRFQRLRKTLVHG